MQLCRWLVISALLGSVGCDSKTAPPATTPPADAVTADPAAAWPAEPASEAPAWAEMTHEQKAAHMEAVVLPDMTQKFQAFDAERFANFGCPTCHGPSAAQGQYDMPSPSLPKLPPWEEMEKSKPEWVKFMVEVEVAMTAHIGAEPYDPKTHEGFGCGNCHPK